MCRVLRKKTRNNWQVQKGKDVYTIADELEESPEVVGRIFEAAKDCGPDYDVKTIYEKLKKWWLVYNFSMHK